MKLNAKMLLSPPCSNSNDRMKEIDKISEPLELELDKLRKQATGMDYTKNTPIIDRIRELRKQISKFESEYLDLRNKLNPEWANYWNLLDD